MIVDSSAVLAVVLGEPDAERFLDAMATADELAISAATMVEALIVAAAKGGVEAAEDLQELLADLECAVVPFGEEEAMLAWAAWRRFGKGRHPAALNLGDCYSYAAAKWAGDGLLFKGDDFTQTDIITA